MSIKFSIKQTSLKTTCCDSKIWVYVRSSAPTGEGGARKKASPTPNPTPTLTERTEKCANKGALIKTIAAQNEGAAHGSTPTQAINQSFVLARRHKRAFDRAGGRASFTLWLCKFYATFDADQ
jgi:hypothetical protein